MIAGKAAGGTTVTIDRRGQVRALRHNGGVNGVPETIRHIPFVRFPSLPEFYITSSLHPVGRDELSSAYALQ